jgi:aminoglycoside/choline kinase family phosphotransferase
MDAGRVALTGSDQVRAHQRRDFLSAVGWGTAVVTPFPGDASTRSYFRLAGEKGEAILMDAPAGAEAPACPPDATPEERAALGYNALARLAGPNTAAFATLANALTARGFSAPRIFEADLDAGFLILEDLGDDLYARIIPDQQDEVTLYTAAAETLGAIYRSSFDAEPEAFGARWRVQDYDETALLTETELFLDWYAPERGDAPSDAAREEWLKAWRAVLPVLEAHAPGLVLRDYHAENLIWLPDRTAEARVGLLDFQDALFGHPAYDLISLLEDARRDVSEAVVAPVSDRFFDAAGLADREAFNAAAAVLAAQRNAKILGIFVRLARRDGKQRYLGLLPRVARHFVRDISHPALSPVRAAVREIAPHVFAEADQ